MQPAVSVIIPTYKPGVYINICLSSLARQTLSKELYEILVVLNGCADPWLSQLNQSINELKKQYGINCTILHSDSASVSNARNIGLDSAKGDYICFIDDDDYVSSSFLEQLLEKSDHETIALSRPYAFLDGNDDKEIASYRIKNDWNKFHNRGITPFYIPKRFFDGPCMKLIHKDIIADRRFDPRFRNGEDSIFMFLISDKIKYAAFCNDEAIYYRRFRDGSAQSLLKDWKKRPVVVWNKFRMYTKYYLSSPFKYSLRFYFSRLIGTIGTLLNG